MSEVGGRVRVSAFSFCTSMKSIQDQKHKTITGRKKNVIRLG